ETATVAEAAGQLLHALDTCVHGLAAGVGNALDDGVDDSPKVIAKHRADSLHRLEAATSEPGDESVPSAERPGGAHVTPERDRELLHGPGSGGAQCGSPEHVEDLALAPIERFVSLEPDVLGPSQQRVAPRSQFAMLIRANPVERVTEVLRDVEAIEADLLIRCRNVLLGRRDVRFVHVHRDRLDRRELVGRQLDEELVEGRLPTAIRDVEDVARHQVGHDGHVVVPLAERGLVHTEVLGRSELAAGQTTRDGARLDACHLVPGQLHATGHAENARLSQPVDDDRLEKGREARPGLGPGHVDLVDTVLFASNSWHIGHEDRPKLAGVEMTPLAASVVVLGAHLVARWAREPRAALRGDVHTHLFFGDLEIDVDDVPRVAEAEDGRVEVAVAHAGNLQHPRLSISPPCLLRQAATPRLTRGRGADGSPLAGRARALPTRRDNAKGVASGASEPAAERQARPSRPSRQRGRSPATWHAATRIPEDPDSDTLNNDLVVIELIVLSGVPTLGVDG